MRSAVRYCLSGEHRVAFSSAGSGPVLLLEPGWVTHLQVQLETASFREFVSGLAQRFTVVRFDKPGCGLSDRHGVQVSLEVGFDEQVAAATAVVDALRARRFSIFGASQGAQVAVALAARDPERVESLVLFGACANGADLAPKQVREALLGLVSAHWGLGSTLLTEMFIPDADTAEVEAFTTLQRSASSAQVAQGLLALYYATDVRALLPQVRARTAVLHREGDAATAFDLGRQVAAGIPDAALIPLAGREHLFYAGDWCAVLAATMDFLLLGDAAAVQLTPRELSVARLVAEGLTNQAIATALGIAVRTADTHVENIRRKLGARSRAQIATWITGQDARHLD